MSCNYCEQRFEDLPETGGAHEFFLNYNGLFYYNPVSGWEGETINYCPWCGEMINRGYRAGEPVSYGIGDRVTYGDKELECAGLGPVRIMDDEPTLNEGPKSRSGILEAAKKCVCQDRNDQYGEPENNFELIARLWRIYLNATGLGFGESEEQSMITAEDVAVMMCLLKIARIATGEQKADSWIDAIGYMACGGEIAQNDDPRKGCSK